MRHWRVAAEHARVAAASVTAASNDGTTSWLERGAPAAAKLAVLPRPATVAKSRPTHATSDAPTPPELASRAHALTHLFRRGGRERYGPELHPRERARDRVARTACGC